MTDPQPAFAARRRLREAFEDLHSSIANAAATFSHEAEIANTFLAVVDDAPSITALVKQFPVAAERARLNTSLDIYETRRRRARAALWQLMLAEGCSLSDITRIFGLSRQLVSRQLREAGHIGHDA
jgi:hypothetical protein